MTLQSEVKAWVKASSCEFKGLHVCVFAAVARKHASRMMKGCPLATKGWLMKCIVLLEVPKQLGWVGRVGLVDPEVF